MIHKGDERTTRRMKSYSRVQHPCKATILQVLGDALLEVGIGEVEITDDVKRKAVVSADDEEEDHVHEKLRQQHQPI